MDNHIITPKDSLRDMALSIRQMAEIDHAAYALEFEKNFAKHIGYEGLGCLAFYWPMAGEADPRAIIKQYLARGGKACLPKAEKNIRLMPFYAWDEGHVLVRGCYGIPEPDPSTTQIVTPDTLIVPMLLVNAEGHRIGYGAGHYDATIASLRAQKRVKTIGIAYDDQFWDQKWEVDQYDQKLDALITPSKLYSFN